MNQSLRDELIRQACTPPKNDQRIEAFCQALLIVLRDPQFKNLCESLNKIAENSPSYAVNKALRVFQYQLLETKSNYPLDYIAPKEWEEAIRSVSADEMTGYEVMQYLENRDIQSNVVERYKAVKLVMLLLGSRIGTTPSLLDVGCSRNHGLKKLALNLPFDPISPGVNDDRLGTIPFMNTTLSALLDVPLCIRNSIGLDLVSPEAFSAARWAKSCSFYPTELLNTYKVAEYDYLDSVQIPEVRQAQHDILQDNLEAVSDGQQFEVIICSTLLYQLDVYERYKVQKMLRSRLRDNGVIIYQDFASKSTAPGAIQFESNWFEYIYPYRTLVEFANDDEHILYEVLRWNNGRCEKWVPGSDVHRII